MATLGCAQARQARRLSYIALCPTRVWTASFPRLGLAAILMQPPMTPTASYSDKARVGRLTRYALMCRMTIDTFSNLWRTV
jgi:hypothetical protein